MSYPWILQEMPAMAPPPQVAKPARRALPPVGSAALSDTATITDMNWDYSEGGSPHPQPRTGYLSLLGPVSGDVHSEETALAFKSRIIKLLEDIYDFEDQENVEYHEESIGRPAGKTRSARTSTVKAPCAWFDVDLAFDKRRLTWTTITINETGNQKNANAVEKLQSAIPELASVAHERVSWPKSTFGSWKLFSKTARMPFQVTYVTSGPGFQFFEACGYRDADGMGEELGKIVRPALGTAESVDYDEFDDDEMEDERSEDEDEDFDDDE